MRRDIGTIIVGILFLAAGIALGGSLLGYFDFRVNLDGWWTLFLIIPALIAIAQGGINAGNIILLGVGVVLLLNAQGVIPHGFTWKLILPVVLLAVGFQLIFGNMFIDRRAPRHDGDRSSGETGGTTDDGVKWEKRTDSADSGETGGAERKSGGVFTEASRSGNSFKTASVFFAGQNILYQDEDFSGGAYTAVFGGLTINLRKVRLQGDVAINVTAIFGGIDLIVPDDVQIVANVIPVLGGLDNKFPSSRNPNAPRIVVNGNAVFGGITIK
jgi:predicted membrane protein